MEFFIEMKRSGDPFTFEPPPKDSSSKETDFSRTLNSAQHLGQFAAYAAAILSTQYRTHTFSVLVMKDYARLIRWDRGGVIFTSPIGYGHLLNFFVRYDEADREVCGHDPTVGPATEEEIVLAEKVPELKAAKTAKIPLLTVTIPEEQPSGPRPRRFVISSPICKLDVPTGRWTRASIALDVSNKRRVLLKDSWRIVHKDIKPEGELYRILHEAKVSNISSVELAGDVGSDTHHQSQTKEIIPLIPDCGRVDVIESRLTTHRHYHIVLRTVGRPLESFTSTRELVCAIRGAMKGERTIFFIVSHVT